MFISKRSFLKTTGRWAALGASSLILSRSSMAAAAGRLPRTPSADLGPFFPLQKPVDSDADLTRIRGKSGRALGAVVEISGRVMATDGTPQPNARLEIWQANAAGRYAHPHDRRADVPLDPNFQGYADLHSDAEGNFRFLTVKPGPYPVGSFARAPHIHFVVRGRDQRLITQLYFPGDDELHAQDQVIAHDLWGKTKPLPSTIFGQLQKEGSRAEAGATHYKFDIVLFDGDMGVK
jgi:protocatechuate 3,4-dioxygenase beta subunit